MTPIRILLADDHALVRAGFRALLADVPGIQVVAEAGDGREALRLAQEHQPDVVLMDIAMPGLNGLEATARIGEECPYVRVIILSMHANEEYVRPGPPGRRRRLLCSKTPTPPNWSLPSGP